MFITNAEKEEMRISIRRLQAEVRDLSLLISKQNARPTVEKKRKPRNMTEESRAATSERMKKYWADRKAKKESV